MEENSKGGNLVPQKHEMSVSSGISLTASQQQLAIQLRLTALNAKTEPASELAGEFNRVFGPEQSEAIKWAFEAWRSKSGYFPAISDIHQLVEEWHRGAREQQELRDQLREKMALEEAREAGLLVPFEQIREQFLDVVERCKMTEPVKTSRMRLLMQARSLAGPAPAPLKLTREQIEARRPAERAEIERVRRQMEEDANGTE